MAAKRKPPPTRTRPQTGAGRPRKPPPPQGKAEEREAERARLELKEEIAGAEADRVQAARGMRATPSIAAKRKLLEAGIRVASSHGALCRLLGNYTHALAFAATETKLHAQHALAIEQQFADDLEALEGKVKRERAAVTRAGER